jgi:hypothetical protein
MNNRATIDRDDVSLIVEELSLVDRQTQDNLIIIESRLITRKQEPDAKAQWQVARERRGRGEMSKTFLEVIRFEYERFEPGFPFLLRIAVSVVLAS